MGQIGQKRTLIDKTNGKINGLKRDKKNADRDGRPCVVAMPERANYAPQLDESRPRRKVRWVGFVTILN